MNPALSKSLRRLAVAAFWLALWQLAAAAVGKELLLPGPTTVLKKLIALASTETFWITLARTILRVLTGILAGVILGMLAGYLTHKSKLARELLSPVMMLLKSTPVASFIILALVWLGRDAVPVFIAGLMVLPVVWANTAAGLAGIDPQLLELAAVYRFPRMKTFRRIMWPSLLPYLRSALRSALGLGWKAGIAAEVLTVPPWSIGKSIYEAKLYLETTELFSWTAAVVLLSFVIEHVILRVVDGIGRKERAHAET